MSPSSDPSHSPVIADPPEYSPAERQLLLRLAHQSIAAALDNRVLNFTAPAGHLAELRGAFVTLHLHGNLRGCIGYVVPNQPLFRTVADAARAAAFDDPRFQPVTPDEALELKAEISVLSPLRAITPSEVVVGKHGLVVTQGPRRGLLLPQVPVEWGWDRETFLAQTCLKAGLEPDAWQYGVELQTFTAVVFSEE